MKSNSDYVSRSGFNLLGSKPQIGLRPMISNILGRQSQCHFGDFMHMAVTQLFSRDFDWNICVHSWGGDFF